MANAAELLKEGTFSLAEISERIGFNDYYYFIRAFRKYYGITPSRYRKGQV
jgi:AraC-like DNA-binding protein